MKRHMMLWRKRFQRNGANRPATSGSWNFNGAAHHTFTYGCSPYTVGRSGRRFRNWLSQEWADIVAHPDPEQRARHLLTCTAVDILNGLRACDPKRLAIYFTKHSSPNQLGDKEYQHIVPQGWQHPGHGPGRVWGARGCSEQPQSWRSPRTRT